MNANISSLLTTPLVPLGCLTLPPLEVPPLEDRVSTYDYGQPVLAVAMDGPGMPFG
jgi:hypothetical protein